MRTGGTAFGGTGRRDTHDQRESEGTVVLTFPAPAPPQAVRRSAGGPGQGPEARPAGPARGPAYASSPYSIRPLRYAYRVASVRFPTPSLR